MRTLHLSVVTLCLVLGLVICAMAGVPQRINQQGRLVDGTNLVNDNVAMVLRLYDAPAGGTVLYADSNSVTVIDGLYSTFIGDDTLSGSLVEAITNAEV